MKRRFILRTIIILGFGILIIGFSNSAIAFDPFRPVGDNSVCGQTSPEGESPVCEPDGSNPITGPDGVITKIADIFALITGVAAVVAIIVGGFEYVRSGGESAKVNKAKNTIMFAVIGLIVVVAARSLVVLAVSKL